MAKRAVNELITGNAIAREKGFADHRTMIQGIYDTLNRQGSLMADLHINDIDVSQPILARVDHGRWGANCECGGAEYVDPSDPIFYCFGCGNEVAGGKLRPVQFPSAQVIEDIELLLCERPINVNKGLTKSSINLSSTPLMKGMGRDWDPEDDPDLSKVKANNKNKGLEDDPVKIKAAKEK